MPLLFALVASAGCKRNDGGGARIAEPDGGPWTVVCAVEVTGPPRKKIRETGEANHRLQREAKRLATANACGRCRGGAPCTAQTAGWHVAKEDCERLEPLKGRTRYRCVVAVERAAGGETSSAQGEAKTEEMACERARLAACEEAGAAQECVRLAAPWTERRTVGRRRP